MARGPGTPLAAVQDMWRSWSPIQMQQQVSLCSNTLYQLYIIILSQCPHAQMLGHDTGAGPPCAANEVFSSALGGKNRPGNLLPA